MSSSRSLKLTTCEEFPFNADDRRVFPIYLALGSKRALTFGF
jgi:hypothetical protein